MSAIPVITEERTRVIEILKEHGYEVDNLSSGLVMHRENSFDVAVQNNYITFYKINTALISGELTFTFNISSPENLIELLKYIK